MTVIISNGFCKFHMAPLAAELDKRNLLVLFMTGLYPTRSVKQFTRMMRIDNRPAVARLIDREEPISVPRIVSFGGAELMYQFAIMIRQRRQFKGISSVLNAESFKIYARRASRVLRSHGKAKIYHYRAGMGHDSVKTAKELGMIALCDHSVAYPGVKDYMVTHGGAYPPKGAPLDLTRVEKVIYDDINLAEYVLVNSHFVKETMVHAGWAPERIFVVYLGVDDSFFSFIPERSAAAGDTGPLRFLFAGAFNQRKGADTLVAAFQRLGDLDWQLGIAGSIESDFRQQYASFFSDPRVRILGTLKRRELAREMTDAEVFVFPSLAEGSARVVFEAMACGCDIITTPNTGSIVEDGVHGDLVAPGDVDALEKALRKAIAGRKEARAIGERNAKLVSDKYRQSQYGSAVAEVYERLLQTKAAAAR